MASGRADNCSTCYFFDWHRTGTSLGNVSFAFDNPFPTVVNAPGVAPSVINAAVVFSTVGTLPPPLQLQTAYFVIPVDLNNFQISAAANGPAIITTGPGTLFHTGDLVALGCHRDAPQSSNSMQAGNPQKSTWQPVDADYWCGEFLLTYPPGSPTWTPWTSTLGASGGGTYTVASIASNFAVTGKVVVIEVTIVITNAGTAAGNLTFTLPSIPQVSTVFDGFDTTNNVTVAGVASAGSNLVTVRKYDGTSVIGVKTIVITGLYQSQ